VEVSLDHVVIHVRDWRSTTDFYGSVLGLERVPNPEGAANPLGSVAFRCGRQQINVHGPWPGSRTPCCPPPLDEIGRADLAFATELAVDEIVAHLAHAGVEITDGPIARFGGRGWGTSVYCRDPSGNGVEVISYASRET
jgi:catechol 2,3-dioxygenase-like lactoylglutathione lyase family enzyme